MSTGMLPDVSHPDFAPFWQGCAERRLVMPRCANGHVIWPPRPACLSCSALLREWAEVPGAGRLYSWTVVHRTRLSGYADQTPYMVGIVTLDLEQPVRMVGRCALDPDDAADGVSLVVDFEDAGRQLTMPFWRLAGDPEGAQHGS
jgi:uncharacterized OB-fold protein